MAIKSDHCQAPNCQKLRDKKQGSAFCTMHRVRRSRYKSLDLPEKKKLPEGIVKICLYHGEITSKDAYKIPGTEWLNCKICKRERSKKFKENNPEYTFTRNYYFFGKTKPRLKISVNEYEKILKKQNGLCKICKQPETMKGANVNAIKRLAIDHKHDGSNKIRGLLCHHCNVSLGGFKDSIEILKSAIEYLEESNID